MQRMESPVDIDESYHVVFDALFDQRHELPETFIYPTTHLLIGSSVKRTLAESKELFKEHIASPVVGMNLLPTFVAASTKAFCPNDEEAEKRLGAIALMWNWNLKRINDIVGM